MTSACGEANKLLAMVCQVFMHQNSLADIFVQINRKCYNCTRILQPAEVIGLVEIPGHIRFWGIDSGIRHR